MRIVIVAGFDHNWSTETHLARDAENLGLIVTRVLEPRTHDGYEQFAQDLPIECLGADLMLYMKHRGLPPEAEKLWRRCEESCLTASFHLDKYVGLPRESEIGVDPFWKVGTVFTADGSEQTQAWMAERGVNHRWLPPACVSDECVRVDKPVPIGGRAGQGAPIVFVGSTVSYHPEWSWRMEMLAALRSRYGSAFDTYGPPDVPTRGLDLNRLYQQPGRVVVGDSLALPGHRAYFSDRYWETIGRGGFLIAPRVPGIEEFFTDWIHLRFYEPGDVDSLFALIDLYLDAPEAARAMANAGQAHVAATATYRHRVAQMLAELGLS